MNIKVTEKTGIRHEGLGHLRHGEVRDVDDALGAFFVANGWAEDVDGNEQPGERGKLDRQNPLEWAKSRKAPKKGKAVQPRVARHK